MGSGRSEGECRTWGLGAAVGSSLTQCHHATMLRSRRRCRPGRRGRWRRAGNVRPASQRPHAGVDTPGPTRPWWCGCSLCVGVGRSTLYTRPRQAAGRSPMAPRPGSSGCADPRAHGYHPARPLRSLRPTRLRAKTTHSGGARPLCCSGALARAWSLRVLGALRQRRRQGVVPWRGAARLPARWWAPHSRRVAWPADVEVPLVLGLVLLCQLHGRDRAPTVRSTSCWSTCPVRHRLQTSGASTAAAAGGLRLR